MRHVKLDKIDLRILRDLQADGRMTNVELARRAGISAPPCLRRVRALEEAGLIRGYDADANAEDVGYAATTRMSMRRRLATRCRFSPMLASPARPSPTSRHSKRWSRPGRRFARRT